MEIAGYHVRGMQAHAWHSPENNLLALSALDKHMDHVPCGPLKKALEPELTTAARPGT